MSTTRRSTETWDSLEEAGSQGRLLPRLIRLFRADDPLDSVEEFALSPGRASTIGRGDSSSDSQSDESRIWSRHDGLMSSRHATVSLTPRGCEITDAGSKNGTFLNGQRMEGPVVLNDGDILECGHSFFIYREQEPVAARCSRLLDASKLATPPLYYQLAPMFPYVASAVSLHLHGETGTGKEVVARAVHELSGRRGAFVAINCAAIPDGLFESELFGYIKGAFSGAATSQRGLVLAANEGTLFLDEIGEVSLAMQAKLLRVLELKEVLPLGASTPIPVNFRLISATLRNIKLAVEEGRFRADLYGRLGTNVCLPRLRENKEELGRLISAFFAAKFDEVAPGAGPRPRVYFTLPAARALVGHSWPYNVRELKQAIDSALTAAMADRESDGYCAIKLAHLPASVVAAECEVNDAAAPVVELRQLSDDQVLAALQTTHGNRAEAAKLLGVSERTVFRRIRKLRQPASG